MGIFLSKKMRYFMVIMEKKNFGMAAEELCITRSPLSKVLTELESSLGGKLFSRKHNDLEPTPLAWDCYNRCLPAYQNLLMFEESLKKSITDTHMTIYFDISAPYGFCHHLERIVESENLRFEIKREQLNTDEFIAFSSRPNVVIVSFRPLEGASSLQCDSWHGCHHVILSQESKGINDNDRRFFVWKDQYSHFYKTRIANILGKQYVKPEFIEHNHDLFSLLSFVRSGKGRIVSSDKMANLIRLDGIDIERIHTSYIRCFVYYRTQTRNLKPLNALKELLTQFI